MKPIPGASRTLMLALAVSALVVSFSLGGHRPGHAGGTGGGGGASLTYTIVKLDDAGGAFVGSPSGQASDINDLGHVVGSVTDAATGSNVAAFWEVDGQTSQIVPLGGSFAFGLNNFNEIVGLGSASSEQPSAAGLYWSNPAEAPMALPPLSEGYASVAYAINDAGVICGSARRPVLDEQGGTIGSTDVGVVWRVTHVNGDLQVDGPYPLPTLDDRSQAYAVSESDGAGGVTVVGAFLTAGFARTAAVQWTIQLNEDGTMSADPNPTALEIDEQAAAWGVNNAGWSCGQSGLGTDYLKARVWIGGQGYTLLDHDRPKYALWGPPVHKARDVNDSGVIVGTAGEEVSFIEAVVWPSVSEKPLLLNKFLPKRNAPYGRLLEATAINEAGTIVGIGTISSGEYAFLAIRN